jgi:hypothetical protein
VNSNSEVNAAVERCCVYVTDTSGCKVGRQFAAMDRDGEVISSGLCWRNIRLERGPLSAPQLRMFISPPSYADIAATRLAVPHVACGRLFAKAFSVD